MLESSKNDIEFYNNIRANLNSIKDFDNEEKRILNMCIKLMDIAYGYNKSEEIKDLMNDNRIKEANNY